MIDLKNKAIELRQYGIIKGIRPIFIKIEKGDYPYKGKYVMTIEDDYLHFYQLNWHYNYKRKKARDFLIRLELLDGFRWQTYKVERKRFVLIFKDGFEFTFNYVFGSDETHDNEPNVLFLIKYLKDKKILHKNNLKSGNYGKQKAVSKADQWLTQEIRSPKKRGIFR